MKLEAHKWRPSPDVHRCASVGKLRLTLAYAHSAHVQRAVCAVLGASLAEVGVASRTGIIAAVSVGY